MFLGPILVDAIYSRNAGISDFSSIGYVILDVDPHTVQRS